MTTKIKKISLTFTLEIATALHNLEIIESLYGKCNHEKGSKVISKGDIVKQFIRPLSSKELLETQRNALSNQERMEIWRKGYEHKIGKLIPLGQFVVEIMPRIKEKELEEMEINFFKSKSTKEVHHVPTS